MLLCQRLPSVQGLLIFEAAARHLSFTAAARELGSTQSAVSQQVRGLEQQLELPLFRRIYRGVTLTEEGLQLYEAVQSGYQQMAECLEKLQRSRQHQRINVATDFAFAAYWLLPRLPEFRERHPGIDVRIVTSQGQYDFSAQDVDVAIIFDNQQSLADKTRKPWLEKPQRLFFEKVFPICSPAFLRRHGPVQSHKKLAALPLLKLGADAGQGWQDWNSFFKGRRSQVEPSDPVLTFNNYTLLVQAAIAGQGIGMGWDTLVDDLINSGVLVGLSEFSLSTDSGYFLVEPDPQDRSAAKLFFIDWLLDLKDRQG
ncbi:choline sulfate utilization transcriptional regulator [Motiliproteus sp. MSK22-1]|uniref:choline sulfate utilization transcriptional regulator n=1 Tax=Motiliproteus sp. MSK22-1 TaxID=1897630 RepID=UPI000977B5EE|nr:LysR substrate-binding domain-containing protein [Motiliproteus sp. MSK22-1]OMH25963.1 LysR family transcriptional regulator [Motiliproteus sp. MSK22-1]